jgi:catechol-2,3-dioxygenase
MKRFHVHVAVEDLSKSVTFYASLFGAQPNVQKDDYAKWMIDEPRINFAISQRGQTPGIDHLGFQMDSTEELNAMTAQLRAADVAVSDQMASTCCYAKSDKGWIHDPQGIAWEAFVTHGSSTTYGAADESANACCTPQVASVTLPVNVKPATKPAETKSCCG